MVYVARKNWKNIFPSYFCDFMLIDLSKLLIVRNALTITGFLLENLMILNTKKKIGYAENEILLFIIAKIRQLLFFSVI